MPGRAGGPVLLLLLVLVGGSSLRGQEFGPGEVEVFAPFDSLRVPDAVVARVGPLTISAREFFFSYIFGPAFAKRGTDSRRRFLEFMINEKLLALGAAERGLGRDPRVTASREGVIGDLATEELYRDDVLRLVSVSEKEIDRAVIDQRETVSMRWLYLSSAKDANRVDSALRAGGRFDSIYTAQFAGGDVVPDDRSTTVTKFKLSRTSATLRSAVDGAKAGVASAPVKGPDGWYIVCVDSLWKSAAVTQTDQVKLRTDARRVLTQQKADSLSASYVRTMMLDADPVIERRTFDILRASLGARLLSQERFEAYGLAERFRTEGDSVDYRNPKKYARLTLVSVRSGEITLGEFLAWYELREANVRLRWTSPQAFFLSLEDLVWRMVRDRLLVDRAFQRGLQNRPSVTTQLEWWTEKFLYQAEKDSLARTVGWSDSSLRAYFASHQKSFRRADGSVLPYEEVKEDVLREYYARVLAEKTLRRLAVLRRSHPVAIDDRALGDVPVDAAGDPRAMDIYVVKKGGTLPRPAFPTIDMSWQTWQ